MPVQKFRTAQEAREAMWTTPDDPNLPRRIRRWWRVSMWMARVVPPRGIRKFRTIEEANAEHDSWPRTPWGTPSE